MDRRHLRLGHAVWPTPRIRDFGGWLREEHARRQLSDASLPRILSDVEERELWRAVVLDSEPGRDFMEPNGAARSARQARRALIEYGIPWGALAAHATEESRALLDWNRRFEERCRAWHRISSDRLLELALVDQPGLAWIESPLWRPAARRWLETRGLAPLAPVACLGTGGHRFEAASPADELAAMAEWARRGLDSNPEFRAWICVPDLRVRRAELLDAFDAALAPGRYSLDAPQGPALYAAAGGTPLADFGPARIALDALAAISGMVPFERFSALLREPHLQESPAGAAAAASLDLAVRTRGPHEASLDSWLELAELIALERTGAAPAALQRLRDFQRCLGRVDGHHPLSRWVSVWVEALDVGPWALRHRWSSREFQSAERMRELFAALAMADEVLGAHSCASAARLLERAARDTPFQPQTGIPPVWVSAQLMDPWLAYDGLWITGGSEQRWPPPVNPIALVPVRIQREYGVVAASADQQLQFAADLQERWRGRGARCVFSCAPEGDGLAPALSPLLSDPPPLALAPAVAHPHWQAFVRRARSLESLVDEAAPAFAGAERTRGVATLRAQSRCPFRGFAESRLGAARLQRPQPGFDPRERGEMLHHALEIIWTELRTSAALAGLASAAREELVSRSARHAVDRQCRRRDPGARWRQREVRRMTALLDKWLRVELDREPFSVQGIEEGSELVHLGGAEFKVRIDRVDLLSDGSRVLIDYKTGSASADWRGERPDNPQLPLYARLRPEGLIAVAYGRVSATECGFIGESARRDLFKPGGRPTTLEGMPDFDALVELWSTRIEKLAAEFAAGHAAVAPTLRACASCALPSLCRLPMGLGENQDG